MWSWPPKASKFLATEVDREWLPVAIDTDTVNREWDRRFLGVGRYEMKNLGNVGVFALV